MKQIKQRKRIFILVNLFLFIIMIIFLVVALLTQPKYTFLLVLFLIFWIPIALEWYHRYIRLLYKEKVVQPILEGIRKGLKYNHKVESKIEYKDILYKLKPFVKTFNFNDEIQDKIEKYKYISFDLTASHLCGNKTVIDFKGKVYNVNIGKTHCDYILKGTKFDVKKIDGFEKMDVESIELNEKIDLYTTDPIEIYKVFTPKRIREFSELEFLQDGKSFVCHIGTQVYIFLANADNQFEKLSNEEEIIKEYEKQLETLKSYLKYFIS